MPKKFRFNTLNTTAVPDCTKHRITGYLVPSAELIAALQPDVWTTATELSVKFPNANAASIGKQLQDIWMNGGSVKRQSKGGRHQWSRK